MSKRVAIIADTIEHIGPDLAIKLAERNHNLVLGGAAEGLIEQLHELVAKVHVAPEAANGEFLAKPEAVKH
jgi:hypothetical protein